MARFGSFGMLFAVCLCLALVSGVGERRVLGDARGVSTVNPSGVHSAQCNVTNYAGWVNASESVPATNSTGNISRPTSAANSTRKHVCMPESVFVTDSESTNVSLPELVPVTNSSGAGNISVPEPMVGSDESGKKAVSSVWRFIFQKIPPGTTSVLIPFKRKVPQPVESSPVPTPLTSSPQVPDQEIEREANATLQEENHEIEPQAPNTSLPVAILEIAREENNSSLQEIDPEIEPQAPNTSLPVAILEEEPEAASAADQSLPEEKQLEAESSEKEPDYDYDDQPLFDEPEVAFSCMVMDVFEWTAETRLVQWTLNTSVGRLLIKGDRFVVTVVGCGVDSTLETFNFGSEVYHRGFLAVWKVPDTCVAVVGGAPEPPPESTTGSILVWSKNQLHAVAVGTCTMTTKVLSKAAGTTISVMVAVRGRAPEPVPEIPTNTGSNEMATNVISETESDREPAAKPSGSILVWASDKLYNVATGSGRMATNVISTAKGTMSYIMAAVWGSAPEPTPEPATGSILVWAKEQLDVVATGSGKLATNVIGNAQATVDRIMVKSGLKPDNRWWYEVYWSKEPEAGFMETFTVDALKNVLPYVHSASLFCGLEWDYPAKQPSFTESVINGMTSFAVGCKELSTKTAALVQSFFQALAEVINAFVEAVNAMPGASFKVLLVLGGSCGLYDLLWLVYLFREMTR